MQIVENTYTIDGSGCLCIPMTDLEEMGLHAGDTVLMSYLSQKGSKNDFCEFLLSADSIGETDTIRDWNIAIPADLLLQANIEPDADLRIICCDGCLVIARDASMSVQELKRLQESLQMADELLGQIHDKTDLLQLTEQIKAAAEKRGGGADG